MNKKKLLVLLLSIITVTGCSTPSASQQTDSKELEQKIAELEQENKELKANSETSNETPEAQQPEEESASSIQIGDVIQTDIAEITVKNIEFSYDVLPDSTDGFYTHYPADSGNVYIHIDTDVKNVQKQNLGADNIMTVVADYNDGYTYNSQAIPEDSSTGFTYANIVSINPLETLGVRYLISCPQEVESSESSLVLTFMVGNEKFMYQMR